MMAQQDQQDQRVPLALQAQLEMPVLQDPLDLLE